MASIISQSFYLLRACLLFPFRVLFYPFQLVHRAYIQWTANPEAKKLGDLLRAQLGQSECRFRLDNDSSATITLPDGRKLGYAQYGSPTGKPIIMLHGFPGSRLEMAWHDEIGKKLGARIIGVDRPGFGWSTPQPSRTPKTFAKDVENLAEQLWLEKFAVIGTSGGGPYVMACAAYLPADKLKVAVDVCGMGDIQRFKSIGMGWPSWLGFKYCARWTPGIFRWHARNWPMNRLDLNEEEKLNVWIDEIVTGTSSQKDIAAWKESSGVDFLRLSLRACREAFNNGFDPFLLDAKILGTKWEFQVEDIRPDLCLHLWFGKEDLNVSGWHGVEIAKRFRGNAKLHYLEETHLSLQVKYHDAIFEELMKDL